MSAATVRVQPPRGADTPDDTPVVLLADQFEAAGPSPKLVVHDTSQLRVHWPAIAYPWLPYRIPDEALSVVGAEHLVEPMRDLSRILTWFRGEGYGEIARSKILIDKGVIGESDTAAALRDFLREEQVLLQMGGLYALDRGRLGELGINWNDVRTRTISDDVRDFLERFVRRSP